MAQNRVLEFFDNFGRAREAANIYQELNGLSDAGLKARGLSRRDLPTYAFDRAFGKK